MMILPVKKVALCLAVAVFCCYLSSLGGSFHFDDSHVIQENFAVHSLSHLVSFWTDPRTSSFIPENRVYRPLTYSFYAVCWAIGGGATWPFHVLKMILHFLVCFGLFQIWARLWSNPGWIPLDPIRLKFFKKEIQLNGCSLAFIPAFIFAIHPACSETVDYIAATTTLLCSAFYVWAFYFYLAFRGKSSFLRSQYSILFSLFLYSLAVSSKEEGITLPALVIFTEFYLQKGDLKTRLLTSLKSGLPYILVGLFLSFVLYVMHPIEGNESRGYVSSYRYFITQWRSYLWYMRLWFWPWDLNADSASIEFSQSIFDPAVIQSAIGNSLILGFSWLVRKRVPAILYGLIWFYITISPASSVVVLAEAINEHRMYLPYVGFAGSAIALFFYAGDRLLDSKWASRCFGPVLILGCLGLFIGTQERNRVWANDENLWQDTVEKNPTSGRALNNLGLVYMSRGEYLKANDFFLKCERFWPAYMYCPLNLGISYMEIAKIGEVGTDFTQKAQQALERAYLLNPNNVHTAFQLGRMYEEVKKDYQKALGYYSKSIEITGGLHPVAEVRRAHCLFLLGRKEAAVEVLDQALKVDSANQQILVEKADLEFEAGNLNESLHTYEILVHHNPENERAWLKMSMIAEKQGKSQVAIQLAEKVVMMNPGNLYYRSRLQELVREQEKK